MKKEPAASASSLRPRKTPGLAAAVTRENIALIAAARWLNVSELEAVLQAGTDLIKLSTENPTTKPPSGSLFLYDRSVTRNYKDDGHSWVKKRNSPKVREDHVKLRVNGMYRVAGCYVHSAEVLSMHRRAYHLLDNKSDSKNVGKAENSLILVHYLDTDLAVQFEKMLPQNLLHNRADLNENTTPPPPITTKGGGEANSMQNKNPVLNKPVTRGVKTSYHQYHLSSSDVSSMSASSLDQTTARTAEISQNTMNDLHGHQHYHTGIHNNQQQHQPMAALPEHSPMIDMHPVDFSGPLHVGPDQENMFWSMMMDSMDSAQVAQVLSQNAATYSHDRNLSHFSFSSQLSFEQDSSSVGPTANTDKNDIENESGGSMAVEKEQIHQKGELLPNITDFSPEEVDIRVDKPTKVLISFSSPVLTEGYDVFAAFLGLDQTMVVEDVALSPVNVLNPYSIKCLAPKVNKRCQRLIILVGLGNAFNINTNDPGLQTEVVKSLRHAIGLGLAFGNAINENGIPLLFQAPEGSAIALLSQFSNEVFQFSGGANNDAGTTETDLPAPPAAMASIATALSDFDIDAVTHAAMAQSMDNLCQPHPMSHKRRLSSMDGTHEVLKMSNGMTPSSSEEALNENSETVGAEVDRHCKIRFVEKISTVLAEVEGNEESEKQASQIDATNNTGTSRNRINSGEVCGNKDGGNTLFPTVEEFLDDAQLNKIDDDMLDDLLDKQLIRIVEMLVEMSADDQELKDELNEPDKSGFTLLHYAALYNLQALLPLLLSRGANRDTPTITGNLTPLHLACGAGNTAIVELLVRSGCSLAERDSFGATPAEHAARNGFIEIQQYLENLACDSSGSTPDRDSSEQGIPTAGASGRKSKPVVADPENNKRLLQSAFSNLSLKDKLAINLMMKKGQSAKGAKDSKKDTIVETANESSDEMDTSDDQGTQHMSLGAMLESMKRQEELEKNKDEKSIDVSSCISESDRESLNMAMSLMNEDERNDLEKTSDEVSNDMRKWMLRRNYKTLKEATIYLESSMKSSKAKDGTVALSDNTEKKILHEKDSSAEEKAADKPKPKQKKGIVSQKVKSVKSEALASLVIRKNLGASVQKKPSTSDKYSGSNRSDESKVSSSSDKDATGPSEKSMASPSTTVS